MKLAAILLTVATGAAHAGGTWLACTPIDDPVNGRRIFQIEPCPPGERDIPLPQMPVQVALRDTLPEIPAPRYGRDSWPATAGTPNGYGRTRHTRHGHGHDVRRR